jgi:linearmycin/streptolysin S transport system ATP-binding protein
MSAPILAVRDIRKNYGSTEALRGVSFTVEAGELFGLLGPNGAGKTTLLSILACLLNPTSGSVQFNGKALRQNDLSIRREVGISTQDLAIYFDLTARENYAFFGKLYGLRGADLHKRVDEVLEFVGLTEHGDRRVATFSGGMKRRLNLGAAIVHRPRLLLLDEPTTGVDPQSRNHIFERVRQLNASGTTIIYTSHYMEEVQTLCPRVAILDYGRLIACDMVTSLLQTLEGTITVGISVEASSIAERLQHVSGVRVVSTTDDTITLACQDIAAASAQVMNVLRDLNVELTAIQSREPNLEQVFLHLTETTLRD